MTGQYFPFRMPDRRFLQFVLAQEPGDNLVSQGFIEAEDRLGGSIPDKLYRLLGMTVHFRGHPAGVSDYLHHAQQDTGQDGSRQHPAEHAGAESSFQLKVFGHRCRIVMSSPGSVVFDTAH